MPWSAQTTLVAQCRRTGGRGFESRRSRLLHPRQLFAGAGACPSHSGSASRRSAGGSASPRKTCRYPSTERLGPALRPCYQYGLCVFLALTTLRRYATGSRPLPWSGSVRHVVASTATRWSRSSSRAGLAREQARSTRCCVSQSRSPIDLARAGRIGAMVVLALGLFLSRRGFSFLFGTSGLSAAGVRLDFPAQIGTKGASHACHHSPLRRCGPE